MHGTWQTTGGGDGARAVAGLAAVAVITALTYEAAEGAARMLGDILVIGATALVALGVGIGLTLLAVRLQTRRRTGAVVYDATVAQRQLWKPNPHALPSRPVRAVAPAQSVVNVNIDAGLLAALLDVARRQPVPVTVPLDAEELPR